ncbi:MAG: polyribonucleotide nucleotidyltransferase, polyribonucleotide nucleotidyltransferase [Deltaproteobacteria bacterium CSP1-8]|nr:MAG: polyribonucleotide nucleotidyltransferase, polyribonucleotide nucleotidyltransferase [Deltaproteobacteria bacterium CSP1-8]
MGNVYETDISGRKLSIETGELARQAGGACVVRYGDSVVLVTACASETPRPGIDFLPLVVDYVEKTFAVGKIPGGFFKREGRLSEFEILTSRMIDRPIRPLFPKGFYNEIQVIATVLSADKENDTAVLAMIGASAALSLSGIPFEGPIAGARVGRIDGELVINPRIPDLARSDLNIFVAGSRDAILMVEGEANEVPEEEVLDAILFAHRSLEPVLALQEKMAGRWSKPRIAFEKKVPGEEDLRRISEVAESDLRAAYKILAKQDRRKRIEEIAEAVRNAFPEEERLEKASLIAGAFKELEKKIVRGKILSEKRRIDGRGLTDIRAITCQVRVLPRTHGSAIFTRGETQVLVTSTLGTSQDEQRIDSLLGDSTKTFMLHYNFPPFSVGEVKMLRAPARREVGHGALAERAVSKVLPDELEFPYTIRIVSEVLESNGSSSMATVCGASLSLMDAGIPTKGNVSGIAMGLIKEGDRVAVLSDILGDEDHLGDMDFKVAGTAKGVTAIQMDIKIGGVSREILLSALRQAREGRLAILDKMNAVIDKPRSELSPYAPRIYVMNVKPDKIREIIGPGGKVIRGIQEQTGVKIDIEDDGTVKIAAVDAESARAAISIIEGIVQEAEVGKVYTGRVRRIMEFGAFVELFPGTDGLLHISQISKNRVRAVSDIYKEGDEVMVRVLEIDRDGKIRLSHKEFEKEGENPVTEGEGPAAGEDRAVRPEKRAREGERGDRDRDRGSGRRGRR